LLEILFEDNHLIIVNKKAGDLTQGDITQDETLGDKIKAHLKKKYNKPGNVYLGITHRLDRPTSGAIIFTKTSKALTRLNESFKKNKIKKTYWAIVKSIKKQKSEKLENFLVKNKKQNKSYISEISNKKAKNAILYFNKIFDLDKYSLLSIKLETGRHHQIRTQLSHIGFPIKGDLKYGFPRSNKDGSIHLHSRKINFVHPVSKQNIEVVAKPPKNNIWDLCLNCEEK
jgi:23S rRNA pseudouridine1911/1915/1917 synthase|tara:strand:+ start:6571 stop:7254 length:684 start_codon:yes stop_codon:yes gene_type:complete